MTRTPPAPAELRPLDPRVRVLWWVEGALRTLTLTVMAAVVTAVAPRPVWLALWGVVAASAVSAVLLPPLQHRRWRWVVRDDDVWVRRGLLWVTTTVVPFSRLQFVDTRQGPLERGLGLASLVLYTAALGSVTAIPGLPVAEAEALRERLAQADPDVISV